MKNNLLIKYNKIRNCLNLHLLILALIFSFELLNCSTFAEAGLVKLDSTTGFASFQGDDLHAESPLFELFQASYLSDKGEFEFNTNFRILDNPSRSESSWDIYSLDGSVWLIPENLKLSFGRSLFIHMTVRPHLLDSLSLETFMNNKTLRYGAYLGIERSPEDLQNQKSKIIGISAGYLSPEIFPISGSLRLEHQVFTDASRNRAKLSLSKPLEMSLSPEILWDMERDLDFNRWIRTEAGLDLYPNLNTTLGLKYQLYELDPLVGKGDDPILNILAEGRVQEMGAKIGYLLTRDIYGSYYYGTTQFLLQEDHTAHGERHQVGINANFDAIKMNSSLYRVTSYGGWVEGIRGGLNYKINSQYELFTMSDYSKYEKITSSKRLAYNNQIGLSIYALTQYRIDSFIEFNSNNANYEDFRFLIKLCTLFWKET